MTFSWQMIGGFGHLRHFRLGLPIRLPVLFTFTARFLSTEEFVFIQCSHPFGCSQGFKIYWWPVCARFPLTNRKVTYKHCTKNQIWSNTLLYLDNFNVVLKTAKISAPTHIFLKRYACRITYKTKGVFGVISL